jgi:hypothetical protein
MKYGGMEIQLHEFLTSAIAVGEVSASCPGRFIPRENLSVPTE